MTNSQEDIEWDNLTLGNQFGGGYSDKEREALLLGAGGWLKAKPAASLSAHVRGLWDIWWKFRGSIDEMDLSLWTLHGVRPLNRPERRLAALAWMGSKRHMRALVKAVKTGDSASVGDLMKSCSHEEWDYRYSIRGKRSEKRQRLIGADRIERFLFNVFWPLAYAYQPELVEQALPDVRVTGVPLAVRRALVRLFGDEVPASRECGLLVSEGLLQIYQDFCLEDHTGCDQCHFPEWVEHWKKY